MPTIAATKEPAEAPLMSRERERKRERVRKRERERETEREMIRRGG